MGRIITRSSGAADADWELALDDGRPRCRARFLTSDESTVVDELRLSSQIEPNEWVHLACTFSFGSLTIWVDGEAEDTMDTSGGVISETDDASYEVTLGNLKDGGANFHGRIDEVRIHNFALLEEEIQLILDASKPNEPPTGIDKIVC